MSFGTGHHETTWLVMKLMLGLDFKNKKVLDMGCGTGILSILASMAGAENVSAIDIDHWSIANTKDNIALNNAVHINVEKGDSDLIKNQIFEVILANINKNVLLVDIKKYAQSFANNGTLILSGFFDVDTSEIIAEANKNSLFLTETLVKNHWAALKFEKTED